MTKATNTAKPLPIGLDFVLVVESNVPQAKCGFCNAVGDPIAVVPADPTLQPTVILLLCKQCGAVLAALPRTRPETLRA